MAFTVITCGFGGSATIANYRVLLNSFSLSMNTNLVVSQGSLSIWNNTNSNFNRFGTMAVKDFSGYELSLSFDLTEIDVFNTILSKCINYPHGAISVSFSDLSYSVSYTFSTAYIKSLSIGVETNSLARADLTMYIPKRDVIVDFGPFTLKSTGSGITNLDMDVMPYWKFSASISSFTANNLGFTFSFSQEITQKFGCVASSATTSVEPMKLIFSKPNVTFSAEYLIRNSVELTISEYNYSYSAGALTLNYGTTNFLTGNNAVIETITPSHVGSSSYQSVAITGIILGGIVLTRLS